ncbi:hypothetical protein [Marinobacterium weihaiense]|uniref:Uncharacterized protein n=1 Tax=Marinobacterium weihaiense TaxID=2851016 RepID=A0ABS6M775_9GAMM|nr:hypothetical protein [Marinobacterium weihaiense]MBV0931759.1 hypothetical protein [Marinobacterium weihaiense]
MLTALIAFQDGTRKQVYLQTRPFAGEYIEHAGDRYQVKEISHVTADTSTDKPPKLIIKVGVGRKSADAMENSARGFFTGS